jgi:hypothetical protein
MSNRRRSQHERRQRIAERSATRKHPLEGMEPWLWAIQDADEAERRGDVPAALEAMLRRPYGPDGQPFWRPERLRRLRQLETLDHRPGWMTSRWILAQAAGGLDDDPAAPERRRRALAVAQELSGVAADDEELSVRLLDHDWFYRQVLLYEEGVLADFLQRLASPDLVAGADRVTAWASTSMGGFVYLGATAGVADWIDLATDQSFTLPDIGSGSMLRPGLAAIGRLVPVDGGSMFESAPQEAPIEVARAVALDPAAWLEVVRDAGDEFRDGEIVSHVEDFAMGTDVARAQWLCWLSEWRPARASALQVDEQLLGRAVLDRAARELPLTTHRFLPDDERYDEDEQEGWEPWACLGAALLEPDVLPSLPAVVTAADLAVLDQLQDRVAEPVRSMLGDVILRWRAAA